LHACVGCIERDALQVDRIEAEVMQLVPGVRYVDLETDRGRFSSYAKSALTQAIEEVRAETFHDSKSHNGGQGGRSSREDKGGGDGGAAPAEDAAHV
jgi:solute carrier family 30 (zinc transporter), member 9